MQIVALDTFSVMSLRDLDIWRTNLKIHRVHALPIYQPSYVDIRWKITEKWYTTDLKLLNRHFLFCVLVTLTFDLRTSKCIQLFCMSLSIDRLNLRRIGQKRLRNRGRLVQCRTDFQRVSSRHLDLCHMTLQMQMYTVLANVYTPAKFHQYRMKNDREIATSAFSIVCPCDLDLWPSYPTMYTALLQVLIYHLAKFEKDGMINGWEIV